MTTAQQYKTVRFLGHDIEPSRITNPALAHVIRKRIMRREGNVHNLDSKRKGSVPSCGDRYKHIDYTDYNDYRDTHNDYDDYRAYDKYGDSCQLT